jgi:deoxyinosine 3'endonuclease (endonuclease V)
MSVQAYSARVAIFVLRYPDLTFPEEVIADAPLVFPYAPGLLVFREGSAMKP